MIYVSAGDEDEVELILKGVDISCEENSPIFIASAGEVKIKANKKTTNTITDKRALKVEDDDSQGEGAIYSTCDLKLTGTGSLTVTGSYNNGIHGKDDVSIKNQTLIVSAPHHAVKGNDSISIEEGGNFTFIGVGGDGLHTENSDISSKGKQRGDITITAGDITIYSATDGIDAAHDVIIQDGVDDDLNATTPKITIYTNKYAGDYVGEAVETSNSTMYLKTTSYSSSYRYSVYFYNDDLSSGVWADATYKTSMSEGQGRWSRSTYYYYELSRPSGYSSYRVYRFSSSASNSLTSYSSCSNGGVINTNYDTVSISVSSSGITTGSWSNFSSSSSTFGPGGMMDQGNKDKAEVSAKGIKADNAIQVDNGSITIQAYDDGLHANYGATLENGLTGAGDIYVNGGQINITASDDGLHADSTLSISGGTLYVSAYEGLEGNHIEISGGTSYVYGTDDAVNATKGKFSEIYLKVSGGYLFAAVPSNGDVDGIDSNGNIYITGGVTIACGPSSGMASALDYDGKASVSGGTLLIYGRPETEPSYSSSITRTYKSGSYASGNTHTVTIAGSSITTGTFKSTYSSLYCYSQLGSLTSAD